MTLKASNSAKLPLSAQDLLAMPTWIEDGLLRLESSQELLQKSDVIAVAVVEKLLNSPVFNQNTKPEDESLREFVEFFHLHLQNISYILLSGNIDFIGYRTNFPNLRNLRADLIKSAIQITKEILPDIVSKKNIDIINTHFCSSSDILLDHICNERSNELTKIDPDANASGDLQGFQQKLLNAEGGFWNAAMVMNVLHCIDSRFLDTMREQGKILGVWWNDQYVYPSWQFVAEGKILAGLPQLLRQLGTFSAWDKLSYILSPNHCLNNQNTPLEELRRGNIEDVILAATE
jgi:hypothetical protein